MTKAPIGWTVQFKINPGKAEAFQGIVRELAGALERTEPRTLMYQWFLSQDEVTCHVWCDDQDAILAHVTGIGPSKYLPRLLELSTLARFDVFGSPNAQLAKILEAFPVTSRNPHVAGFGRWR